MATQTRSRKTSKTPIRKRPAKRVSKKISKKIDKIVDRFMVVSTLGFWGGLVILGAMHGWFPAIMTFLARLAH